MLLCIARPDRMCLDVLNTPAECPCVIVGWYIAMSQNDQGNSVIRAIKECVIRVSVEPQSLYITSVVGGAHLDCDEVDLPISMSSVP